MEWLSQGGGRECWSAHLHIHSLGLTLCLAAHQHCRTSTHSTTCRSASACKTSKLMQGQSSHSHHAKFACISLFSTCSLPTMVMVSLNPSKRRRQELTDRGETHGHRAGTPQGTRSGEKNRLTMAAAHGTLAEDWVVKLDNIHGWPALFPPRHNISLNLYSPTYSLHFILDTIPPGFHLSALSPSSRTLPGIHTAHTSAKGINGFSLKLWERNALSINAYHCVLLQ